MALALLAVGLGVLMRGLIGGLGHTSAAERDSRALALAESKLAEFATLRPIEVGTATGTLAGGLTWRVDIQPHGDAGLFGVKPAATIRTYSIQVSVAHGDAAGRGRPVVLETLRLEAGR